MATFGSGYNLPPGCYEHHLPGNRPEDQPVICECGEELYPGNAESITCDECGTTILGHDEAKAEAEIEAAERMADERRLD